MNVYNLTSPLANIMVKLMYCIMWARWQCIDIHTLKIRQTNIKSMKFTRTVHVSHYIQGRPHVGEKLLGFGSSVKLCIFQVYKLTLTFLFYLIFFLVQINLAGLHHWMETFLQSVILPVSCTNQHWNHCPLLTSMSPSYGRHKWWTPMAGYHKKGFFRILFLPL